MPSALLVADPMDHMLEWLTAIHDVVSHHIVLLPKAPFVSVIAMTQSVTGRAGETVKGLTKSTMYACCVLFTVEPLATSSFT